MNAPHPIALLPALALLLVLGGCGGGYGTYGGEVGGYIEEPAYAEPC